MQHQVRLSSCETFICRLECHCHFHFGFEREYFIGRKLAYKQKEVDGKNWNSRVKFKSVHLILNRTKAMQYSKNRLWIKAFFPWEAWRTDFCSLALQKRLSTLIWKGPVTSVKCYSIAYQASHRSCSAFLLIFWRNVGYPLLLCKKSHLCRIVYHPTLPYTHTYENYNQSRILNQEHFLTFVMAAAKNLFSHYFKALKAHVFNTNDQITGYVWVGIWFN